MEAEPGLDLLMRVRRWSFSQACEEVERYLGLEPDGTGRHRPQPVSTGNGTGANLKRHRPMPLRRRWTRAPSPSGVTAMRRGTRCSGSSGSAWAARAARFSCIGCGSMAAGTGPAAVIPSPASGLHPGRSAACRA